MDVEKRKTEMEKKENDIIYSRAVKAGRRIYYLDVKKSRNDDLFLAITESKKKITGSVDDIQVSYEKHKIFLYKEDFDKFTDGLKDVVGFIKSEMEKSEAPEVQKQSRVEDVGGSSGEGESKGRSFFDKFKF
ncbi:MAG: PUR family DNA/RNA-binding protein [Prevotellaceae bacterium]|jgi:hypothetical protein|nr:PUR family DNA/RNA-binding protein [Prevotellaceae bacterium]